MLGNCSWSSFNLKSLPAKFWETFLNYLIDSSSPCFLWSIWNFYYWNRFPGLVLYFFSQFLPHCVFAVLFRFLQFYLLVILDFKFLLSYFNFQRLFCVLWEFFFIKHSILFLFHGYVAAPDVFFACVLPDPRPPYYHVFVLISFFKLEAFLECLESQLSCSHLRVGPKGWSNKQ